MMARRVAYRRHIVGVWAAPPSSAKKGGVDVHSRPIIDAVLYLAVKVHSWSSYYETLSLIRHLDKVKKCLDEFQGLDGWLIQRGLREEWMD